MPDWYPLMAAARYLHVPPWELIKQSKIWQIWGLQAANAEEGARKFHQEQANRKGGIK